MRKILPAAVLLVLTGCSEELTPEEQAMADARDVAMVEAANDVMPPLNPVTPEPILVPDIERFDLYGEACNYAPGTSLGARVIAREADAFMKIAGEVERFSADPGARELPLHSRSLYNSKNYALKLEIEGGGNPAEGEAAADEGSVTLFDEYGRVVYEVTGPVHCAAN